MNLLMIAIACGVIAVLYGILTSRQVLSASAGNQRMIEVAGAIQEGAEHLAAGEDAVKHSDDATGDRDQKQVH